jgi:hypothetical protein
MLPEQTYTHYQQGRQELLEEELERASAERVKALVEAELAQLRAMDEYQREVRSSKREVEELLTLKCPGCGTAFVDFQGCCALACSGPQCNVHFCAWCLTNCGDSASCHRHVASCPERPAGVNSFYGHGQWATFQKHRKVRLVQAALDQLSAKSTKLAGDVFDALQAQFDGLAVRRPGGGAASSSGAAADVEMGEASDDEEL